MIQRCRDPGHKSYEEYGGAGVAVSDAWLDFRRFLADMGERPPGTTVDRIDNSRGYEPGNCRWATTSQQGRSKQSSVYIDFRGERLHLIEVANRTGRLYRTLWRWHKNGVLEQRLGNLG